MARMALAYTSGGVESVALIDQDALDSLAEWLCQDKQIHDALEAHRTSKVQDFVFDKQVKEQGYCNVCKDFAGEILAHFDLVQKRETL